MSNKKKNRQERLRRIVALAMVIFLLLSVFSTVIYYLTVPTYAAEEITANDSTDELTEDNTETDVIPSEDTDETDLNPEIIPPSGEDSTDEIPEDDSNADILPDDRLIRVGLMYGTNITVGFETTADYGFVINKVNRTGNLTSEPLWEIDLTKVSCTVDSNLSKTGMTYLKTSDPAKTVVGGWHIEITNDLSISDAAIYLDGLSSYFEQLDIYGIPSFINGEYRIRAGHFPTKAAAEKCAAMFLELLPSFPVSVVGPTDTAVSLVDPMTDKILFEYDDNDITAFGLTARQSPEGEVAYLVTPAKKLYAGTFMFRRYITDSVDGVSLTDVIRLGDYVKGVISYEISPSWPLEAQKAFAICVRSFVLAKVRHETSYQVDVCNSQHCQVYGGMTRVNDRVNQAVEETAGLVMTYDGEVVEAYYSAVSGGVTVSSYDEWGFQHIPYLVAVETPWEVYTEHSKGAWTFEASPAELCAHLRSKGYTALRGEIKSVTIDKLAENSTHVRQITFTDSYGTIVTVKTCEKVRLALWGYVNSANFVVGKGSVEADKTTFSNRSTENLNVSTSAENLPLGERETITVMTAAGLADAEINKSYSVSSHGKSKLIGTSSVTERVTVKAKTPSNFIFVGKGYGHGVGISQIGIRNLAELGYKAEEILPKYFTGIEIKSLDDVK